MSGGGCGLKEGRTEPRLWEKAGDVGQPTRCYALSDARGRRRSSMLRVNGPLLRQERKDEKKMKKMNEQNKSAVWECIRFKTVQGCPLLSQSIDLVVWICIWPICWRVWVHLRSQNLNVMRFNPTSGMCHDELWSTGVSRTWTTWFPCRLLFGKLICSSRVSDMGGKLASARRTDSRLADVETDAAPPASRCGRWAGIAMATDLLFNSNWQLRPQRR